MGLHWCHRYYGQRYEGFGLLYCDMVNALVTQMHDLWANSEELMKNKYKKKMSKLKCIPP